MEETVNMVLKTTLLWQHLWRAGDQCKATYSCLELRRLYFGIRRLYLLLHVIFQVSEVLLLVGEVGFLQAMVENNVAARLDGGLGALISFLGRRVCSVQLDVFADLASLQLSGHLVHNFADELDLVGVGEDLITWKIKENLC